MTHRSLALPSVLLVLALAGCGSDEPTARPSTAATTGSAAPTTADASSAPAPATTAPVDDTKTFEITVAGGNVTRKSSTFELKRGDKARIVVTSDKADEVHLHTYDVKVDVTPGTPATLDFTATIPGQFEVELENAGLVLVTVSVR